MTTYPVNNKTDLDWNNDRGDYSKSIIRKESPTLKEVD